MRKKKSKSKSAHLTKSSYLRLRIRKKPPKKFLGDEKQRKWIIKTLIKKFGGLCFSCNCLVNLIHNNPKQATIDHIVPKSKGGTDDLNNLRLLCRTCNKRKGNDICEY